MKYGIDIKFSAYFSVDVEANTEEEALEKGRELFRNCEFPNEVEEVETWSENVEELETLI